MRRISIYLLIFILLLACSNGSKESGQNFAIQNNNIANPIQYLNGVWVLSDYINAIVKTKSPLQSEKYLSGIVTMIINESAYSDSIEVGASWNNHEGYSFMVYLSHASGTHSFKTNIPDYDNESNSYELTYDSIDSEMHLKLRHLDKNHNILDEKLFDKVADKQSDNDAAWGLQYMVNAKLFTGHYQVLDSGQSIGEATFKSDGTFEGIGHYKTFYIDTDFNGGPYTETDGISFDPGGKQAGFFGFSFSKDTILLYSIKPGEDSDTIQADKVLYQLIRR